MLYKNRLAGLLVLFLGYLPVLHADPLHDMFAKTLVEAEEGELTSMYDLARMYELGVGTDRNVNEAMVWYQQAALKGNARAAFRLGEVYYIGERVPVDYPAAHKWLLRAAEDGSREARPYLAAMYREGKGVKPDRAEAEKWSRPPEEEKVAEKEAPEPSPAEQPKNVAKPTPVPAHRTGTPFEIVSQSSWSKEDRPALYLPSPVAHCHQEKKDLVCISDELNGQQLNLSYTYRVMSRLSNFAKKGRFDLDYRFQLGGVVEEDSEGYATDDEDEAMVATAGSILDELKRRERELACKLNMKNNLVCQNAKGRKLKFKRAK